MTGYFLALAGMILYNSITSLSSNVAGASRSIANNMLACQASALVAFVLKRTGKLGDPSPTKALINGSLAGLVSKDHQTKVHISHAGQNCWVIHLFLVNLVQSLKELKTYVKF